MGIQNAPAASRIIIADHEQIRHLMIVPKKMLLKIVPFSDQHILRLEKAGRFPARLEIGDNKVGWMLTEIEDWVHNLKRRSYAHDEQPKAP